MKELVESILPIERNIFLTLNGWQSTFMDDAMWTVTGRYIWIPLLLFLALAFFYKTQKKEGLLVLVFFIILFVACDQISSSFFKEYFQRLRPTHHPDFKDIVKTVNDFRGGGYSFISGHATNSFGIAMFLSLIYRGRLAIATFFWAIANSYSRIYMGVHFLSDIIAGAIIGMLIAYIIYLIYKWVRKKYLKLTPMQLQQPIYSKKQSNSINLIVLSYVLLVIAFSPYLCTLKQ